MEKRISQREVTLRRGAESIAVHRIANQFLRRRSEDAARVSQVYLVASNAVHMLERQLKDSIDTV